MLVAIFGFESLGMPMDNVCSVMSRITNRAELGPLSTSPYY